MMSRADMEELLATSRLGAGAMGAGAVAEQAGRIAGFFGALEAFAPGGGPSGACPRASSDSLRSGPPEPGLPPSAVRRVGRDFLDGYLRVPKVVGGGA